MIFYFSISKLYTNSVISSLNTRGQWSYVGMDNCCRDSGRPGSVLQFKDVKSVSPGDLEDRQAVSEPVLGVFLPFFVDGVFPMQPVGPMNE